MVKVEQDPVIVLEYPKAGHVWIFRFKPSMLQMAIRSVGLIACGDGVERDKYLSWYDAAKITKFMRDGVAAFRKAMRQKGG